MQIPDDRKSAYDEAELELCASGDLFGPDGGKLPSGNMLMMNRIREINVDGGSYGKGEIQAELDILRAHTRVPPAKSLAEGLCRR